MACYDEAAAWREIARKIIEGEWGARGLCNEVATLLIWDETISDRVYDSMLDRIGRHMAVWNRERPSTGWHYAYPGLEAEARAFAALWMALEAEAGVAP